MSLDPQEIPASTKSPKVVRKEQFNASDYYKPFKRQIDFSSSNAKYRLFGGAAGPGKTTALLWEAICRANEVRGSNTLLLRRTYPELESSLLAYFRRDVPRAFYKHFNESKRIVTWHNGSTTRFGYCRTENDVYQYQGAEFLFIGIDELTHFTLKQWQFLSSRNRCPVLGSYSCMAGATNPGNIGHSWVKALWVDRKPAPGMENAECYDPADYEFISARIADNPIYAHDKNYRRTLEALPQDLRRAFLEGDWNVFAGQYFDVFEVARHVVRPEGLRLEPWWPRWISIDWGYQHPSAVYWHVAIPGFCGSMPASGQGPYATGVIPTDSYQDARYHDQRYRDGSNPASLYNSRNETYTGPRILTYREFVRAELSPRMLAQAILEQNGRERITEIFLSPDAYSERTAETSIAEQLGEVFKYGGLPQPVRATNERVGGWQLMYQLLEGDRWLIGENCRALVECLPTLTRDITYVEDVRKCDGDDPADSARYGLVSGLRIAFPHGMPPPLPSAHPGSFDPSQSQGPWDRGVPPGQEDAFRDTARPQEENSLQEGRAGQTNFTRADGNDGSDGGSVKGHAAESCNGEGSAPDEGATSAAPTHQSTDVRVGQGNTGTQSTANNSTAPNSNAAWNRFAPPLDDYLARQVSAMDPTSRAIWLQKLKADAQRKSSNVARPHRRR